VRDALIHPQFHALLTSSLQSDSLASNAQYDYAGRMTGMSWLTNGLTGSQTWSYNVNGQTASVNWLGNFINGGVQYVYSATHNNGQITQAIDTLSGETTSYQYDALKRLTSAASTAAWTQTYQYDGFGNLTAKALNGSSTPIPVTAATNHLTNAFYDANGNMTSGAGATLTYDEANRLIAARETSDGTVYYGYSADNKRIDVSGGGSAEQWTFYGARGECLG
jgi:YD repeat-containing protein